METKQKRKQRFKSNALYEVNLVGRGSKLQLRLPEVRSRYMEPLDGIAIETQLAKLKKGEAVTLSAGTGLVIIRPL